MSARIFSAVAVLGFRARRSLQVTQKLLIIWFQANKRPCEILSRVFLRELALCGEVRLVTSWRCSVDNRVGGLHKLPLLLVPSCFVGRGGAHQRSQEITIPDLNDSSSTSDST